METAMTWVRTESGEIREYRTPVGNSVVIVQCRTTSLSDISADWCAEIDGVRTAAIKVTAHTDSAILRHVEQRMLLPYKTRKPQEEEPWELERGGRPGF